MSRGWRPSASTAPTAGASARSRPTHPIASCSSTAPTHSTYWPPAPSPSTPPRPPSRSKASNRKPLRPPAPWRASPSRSTPARSARRRHVRAQPGRARWRRARRRPGRLQPGLRRRAARALPQGRRRPSHRGARRPYRVRRPGPCPSPSSASCSGSGARCSGYRGERRLVARHRRREPALSSLGEGVRGGRARSARPCLVPDDWEEPFLIGGASATPPATRSSRRDVVGAPEARPRRAGGLRVRDNPVPPGSVLLTGPVCPGGRLHARAGHGRRGRDRRNRQTGEYRGDRERPPVTTYPVEGTIPALLTPSPRAVRRSISSCSTSTSPGSPTAAGTISPLAPSARALALAGRAQAVIERLTAHPAGCGPTGTGCTALPETIELALRGRHGAAGILVAPPWYYDATPAGTALLRRRDQAPPNPRFLTATPLRGASGSRRRMREPETRHGPPAVGARPERDPSTRRAGPGVPELATRPGSTPSHRRRPGRRWA